MIIQIWGVKRVACCARAETFTEAVASLPPILKGHAFATSIMADSKILAYLKLHVVDGVIYPQSTPQKLVDNLKTMEHFPDDVWIVAYPKSVCIKRTPSQLIHISWGANHGSFSVNSSGPGGTLSAHAKRILLRVPILTYTA